MTWNLKGITLGLVHSLTWFRSDNISLCPASPGEILFSYLRSTCSAPCQNSPLPPLFPVMVGTHCECHDGSHGQGMGALTCKWTRSAGWSQSFPSPSLLFLVKYMTWVECFSNTRWKSQGYIMGELWFIKGITFLTGMDKELRILDRQKTKLWRNPISLRDMRNTKARRPLNGLWVEHSIGLLGPPFSFTVHDSVTTTLLVPSCYFLGYVLWEQ